MPKYCCVLVRLSQHHWVLWYKVSLARKRFVSGREHYRTRSGDRFDASVELVAMQLAVLSLSYTRR